MVTLYYIQLIYINKNAVFTFTALISELYIIPIIQGITYVHFERGLERYSLISH